MGDGGGTEKEGHYKGWKRWRTWRIWWQPVELGVIRHNEAMSINASVEFPSAASRGMEEREHIEE